MTAAAILKAPLPPQMATGDDEIAVAVAIALEHIEWHEALKVSRRDMCALLGIEWRHEHKRVDLVVLFASAWPALGRSDGGRREAA